jgi:hypothetical protein
VISQHLALPRTQPDIPEITYLSDRHPYRTLPNRTIIGGLVFYSELLSGRAGKGEEAGPVTRQARSGVYPVSSVRLCAVYVRRHDSFTWNSRRV